MSKPVSSQIASRNFRTQAIVAVAAAGLAIIVWNFRDRISDFWSFLGFSSASTSNSTQSSEKDALKLTAPAESTELQKSSEVAPEAMKNKSSSENAENPPNPAEPVADVGRSAPEAVPDNSGAPPPPPTNTSTYIGLPKADPATVSSNLPPQWPGATPR